MNIAIVDTAVVMLANYSWV